MAAAAMSSTVVPTTYDEAAPATQSAVTAASKRPLPQKQQARKRTKTDCAPPPTGTETTSSRDLVLAYMRHQNRPYNSQLIFDNLKRAIKKPVLERLLEELVTDGSLVSKDLGKTRVFMYSQNLFEPTIASGGETASELQEKKLLNSESVKQRAALKQRVEETRARAATLESLKTKIATAEAELQERKRDQQHGAKTVTMAEASATEHLHAKLHAAWATQKRRCQELVQSLAERSQTDEKQLQEELGLERDEDFIPLAAYKSYK